MSKTLLLAVLLGLLVAVCLPAGAAPLEATALCTANVEAWAGVTAVAPGVANISALAIQTAAAGGGDARTATGTSITPGTFTIQLNSPVTVTMTAQELSKAAVTGVTQEEWMETAYQTVSMSIDGLPNLITTLPAAIPVINHPYSHAYWPLDGAQTLTPAIGKTVVMGYNVIATNVNDGAENSVEFHRLPSAGPYSANIKCTLAAIGW